MGSGSRNESNSHQLERVGENNIFLELDVRHVYKVWIKRFWAQEAKMSSGDQNEFKSLQLTPIGEKKIFMNSTYIMSRK